MKYKSILFLIIFISVNYKLTNYKPTAHAVDDTLVNTESININTLEEQSQEIADLVMSPYCPGRTLAACPSDDARQLRLKVLNWLQQGYSKDAIKRQLIGIYGKDILAEPEFIGFGKFAWLSPFFLLLLTFLMLIYILKIAIRKKVPDLEDPVALNNLEEKLKKL